MLSVRVSLEPSFIQFLVKTEPEASQVKLTEVPTAGRFVEDLSKIEAPDIFSVCQETDF